MMFEALFKRTVYLVKSDAIIRRMLTNAGWLLGANSFNMVLAFGQGVLVARLLGVEQYGILGIAMTFVTTVNRLTSFRMNEVVVKYVTDALSRGERNRASGTLKAVMIAEGASSLLAFIIVCVLAPFGSLWFVKSPEATALIYGYAFVILANLISESATGVLQVFNQFHRQAILSTVGQITTFGGVAVAYAWGLGIWGVLFAYLAGQLTRSGALSLSAFRLIKERLGADWWNAPLGSLAGYRRSMAKFAISTNVSATLSLITKDSDLLWLGYFRSPTEVGYYKLAITLAGMVMMPVSPLAQTVYPEITRELALHRWISTRRLLRRGSFVTLLWILPVSLLLVVAGRNVIALLYGTEFLPAMPALVILLAGLGFAHSLFWARPALLALGLPEYPMKVNVAVAILKILAVLAIVPLYGYIGNAAILTGLYFFGVSLLVLKTRATLVERQSGDGSVETWTAHL